MDPGATTILEKSAANRSSGVRDRRATVALNNTGAQEASTLQTGRGNAIKLS